MQEVLPQLVRNTDFAAIGEASIRSFPALPQGMF
jgi:hypothetical protein